MKQITFLSFFFLFCISLSGNTGGKFDSATANPIRIVDENAVPATIRSSEINAWAIAPFDPNAFVTRWKTYISETPVNDRIPFSENT